MSLDFESLWEIFCPNIQFYTVLYRFIFLTIIFNNLVLVIISTQNEINDTVKTVSAQVTEIKDDVKELRTAKEEYEERAF